METTPPPAIDLTGRNFYRSPAQVAVLTFLADLAYLWWWWWQLFRFTKREGFPRARSFWWLLVPFYGLYVLYQQLDDLKRALDATSSSGIEPGTPRKHWFVVVPEVTAILVGWQVATLINAFFLGSNGVIRAVLILATAMGVAYLVRRHRSAPQATINPVLLVALFSIGAASVIPTLNPAFVIAQVFFLGYLDSSGAIPFAYSIPIEAVILGVVLASAVYATQGAANEVLRAKYPDARYHGFTRGEIAATLLGLLLNTLYFYWQFHPVGSRLLETRVAPAGGPYSYEVPAGFHEVGFELPNGVTGAYVTGVDSDKSSDIRDGIFVFIHPLSESLDGVSLSDIKKEIDTSIGGTGSKAQSFASGGWVKVDGMDALEYDYVGLETPKGVADGVIYFLFKGKNYLELNCRWIPRDRAEFVRGCDEVKRTLTFNQSQES